MRVIPRRLPSLARVDDEGVTAGGAQLTCLGAHTSERPLSVLGNLAAQAVGVARADLLLGIEQDDAPACRVQLPHLLIEANDDLVPIGNELAAQPIDVRFAGLPFRLRSLVLGPAG